MRLNCTVVILSILSVEWIVECYKLFSFGVISDIQYSSFSDASNFQGTKIRRYKQSFDIFNEATKYWKEEEVSFSLLLGDVIDGKAETMKDQHDCLQHILNSGQRENIPLYFCFGNHCHYCFTRRELLKLVPGKSISEYDSSADCDHHDLCYSWSPHPGWRFISIDGYDVSTIGARTKQNKQLAKQLLEIHNSNDLTHGQKWSANLPVYRQRWLPYNGGIGEEQLHWLTSSLENANKNREHVVLFCHQSIFAPNRQNSLIWNAEEVLDILWRYDNIVLWIAGHDHAGK